MRKVLLFSMLMAGLVAFVGIRLSDAAGMDKPEKVTLKLAAFGGAKSDARGDVRFTLSKNGDALYYEIDVKGLKDVRMAHIHEFKDGKPGGIIAWLYPAPGSKPYEWPGAFTGTLAAGVLTGDRLEGPAAGKSPKELYEMLESGGAAVAIHTKANPDVELAGVASAKGMHSTAMHKTKGTTAGY